MASELQVNAGAKTLAALKHCKRCKSVDLTEMPAEGALCMAIVNDEKEVEECGQTRGDHLQPNDKPDKHRIKSHKFEPDRMSEYRCEMCGLLGTEEEVIA